MKLSHLKMAIKAAISSGTSLMIEGSPGLGKSAAVEQAAEETGAKLKTVIAILLDPVDLRGIPTVTDGMTHWCPPDFLPTDPGPGILFLDELSAAPASVQAALYQLVYGGRLGDYTLPQGWVIVAAGNKTTDRAVAIRMGTAMASRFVHVDAEADLDDWCNWAFGAAIRPEIIAFLRFRPELLHAFDPHSTEKAFPCPRTWAILSGILANLTREIELPIIQGVVGKGAAAEFVAYLRIWRELPSLDAIRVSGDAAPIPEDLGARYAVCTGLAATTTPATCEQVVRYALRLPPQFSVMLLRTCMAVTCPEVVTAPSFQKWAVQYSEVMK